MKNAQVLKKEGNINFVNTKVIDASFNNLDCKVKTETTIEGKNIRNKVTYENTKENILDIKDAYSEIDANLDVENLVNNVSNNTVLTLTLKTNEAKYSLFRNPTISIEMPEEIEDVQLEQPSLMYNNKIFEITNAYITTNEKGNKVLNIVLLGNQNTYEEISFINGTDIIIPLTITLKKEIETKTSSLKLTYTNEVTDKTAYNIQEKEYEEIDISILNKIGTVIPKTTSNVDENTIVYEDDEVKVEVIELLGKNVISNGGILYEEQIVRNKIKITNKSNISKNITITANLPKEILYAKLHVVGVVHNEEYDYYLRGKKYEYVKDRQVKETSIDSGALTPGATYEGYFDTYINDLNDDLDNVETAIRYDIKINKTKIQSFEVKNIIKQAEIGIEKFNK